MFARLNQWYLQPTFQHEEEKRVARVLFSIIAASLAAYTITILASLYWRDWGLALAALVGILLQAGPLYLLAHSNLRACSLITSLIILFETTLTATIGAGIHDIAVTAYPAIIVIASLLDQRTFRILCLLTIVSVGWLVFGQANGWFVPLIESTADWFDYLIVTTILLGTALVVNSMSRNIWERLLEARMEIAERKRVEVALQESEAKFHGVFEHSLDAMFVIDENGQMIEMNRAAERMLGATFQALQGKFIWDIQAGMAPADRKADISVDTIRTNIQEALRTGHSPWLGHLANSTLQLSDGRIRHIQQIAFPIPYKNRIRIASMNRDVTEQRLAEEELRRAHEKLQAHVTEVEKLQLELHEQALRDPLTGLYNRRYLDETMERELARVKREKQAMSVVVSDIDHFKKINDKYGHQVGDEFLKAIANLIVSHTRSSDVACRYGGEEFLLVMPGTTPKLAAKRAEELRLKCEQICIRSEKKDLNVTLSFGVAAFPSHGQAAEEIFIKADRALYKSKRSGRNRVTVWGESKDLMKKSGKKKK